jgi:hypothetical protein
MQSCFRGMLGVLLALPISLTASPVALHASTQSIISLSGDTRNLSLSQHAVFDTQFACEMQDIPDAPARAFRDYHGMVHLISTHFVARAMIGKSLRQVKRDCRVIYRSPKDTNPAHFADNNWLYSFYTIDGKRIAALVHSEYDAFEIADMCSTPSTPPNCWWNSITFAVSRDGGGSFSLPKPPGNLVASVPYPYVINNEQGAYGYSAPSNIVQFEKYFYVLINNWPHGAQKYGPCLLRTKDVFDPSKWRAWDGSGFRVQFVNPYTVADFRPEEHVCQPVFAGEVTSLVYYKKNKLFLATEYATDNRFGPNPGVYVVISTDLVNWSPPILILETKELLADQEAGNWSFGYFSLIDPLSDDLDFTTVSDTPDLYYVRFDKDHAPYSRVLFRRPLSLRALLR